MQARRESRVGFLRDALRTPSVAPTEKKIGALIANRLSSSRADVSRWSRRSPSAPTSWPARAARATARSCWSTITWTPSLLGRATHWSVDPFGAQVRDGWVWGRGAVDLKGGLCAMVMATVTFLAAGGHVAARRFHDRGVRRRGRLAWRLGTRHLLKQGLIRGDYGIVCEPTGNRIEIAAKGVLHVAEISTKGRMAHGGKPWAGINAIAHMAAIIEGINGYAGQLAQRSHPIVGAPSVTMGTIQGGTVPNMVASDCRDGPPANPSGPGLDRCDRGDSHRRGESRPLTGG